MTDVVLGVGGGFGCGFRVQGFRMWRLGLILPPIINNWLIHIYIYMYICIYRIHVFIYRHRNMTLL